MKRCDHCPSKPMAALTFDDGPSVHTVRILDTLEKYCVPATFFVVGNRVEEGSGIIKRAFDMGNEIGNHSWTHPNLTLNSLTPDEIKKELNDTSSALQSVTGVYPKVFRPPYGAVNETLKSICTELNLPIINWSIDSFDWECKNADIIYKNIFNKLHNHAIILSHDFYDSTADAMERVIPELISREYQLVTVSELMQHSGVILEAGVVYNNG